MSITYDIIRLKELDDFMADDRWDESDVVPLSSLRRESYLKNPKADENDVVMICAFDEEMLVGFRLLLPDCFYQDPPLRYAWKSGIWVRPTYRGRGLARSLTKMALEAWDDCIAGIDYAPESKSMYLGTGNFQEYQVLGGLRYYRKFCFSDLFKVRFPYSVIYLLDIIDRVGNSVLSIVSRFRRKTGPSTSEAVDLQDYSKVLELEPRMAFMYKEKDLQWIGENPWVSSDNKYKSESIKFPFSLYAKDYYNKWKLLEKDGDSCIIHIILKEGHMEIPHLFQEGFDELEIARYLEEFISNNDVNYVTSFNPSVQRSLEQLNWLYRKEINRDIMGTKKLKELIINEGFAFSEGDGDVSFT